MNLDAKEFRNLCAEEGFELTPAESEKYLKAYNDIRDSIKEAIEECPTYYRDLCNRTTEEKLRDIAASEDKSFGLKEYNEVRNILILVCKMEGYAN